MRAGPTVKPRHGTGRGGAGAQGTRGSGRGTLGSPMGTPLDSKGPLPSVPPPPCRSCPPSACGAGNAAPARTLLAPGPAALCAFETLHHGDAPREQLLGDVRGCVCATPNPVPPIGGIACAPLMEKDLAFSLEVGSALRVTRPVPRSPPGRAGPPGRAPRRRCARLRRTPWCGGASGPARTV